MPVARRQEAGWLLLAMMTFAAGTARADGAFPDAQTILLPADRPDEILLATNFGVLASEDAGASWIWSCEQPVNSYGRLYQMGPAPVHRLYTVAGGKLVFSDDGACGWQVAGGALSTQLCEDAFVDPTDGTRVLAAGLTSGAAGAVYTRPRIDRRRRDVRPHALHRRAGGAGHGAGDRRVRSDDH